MASSKNNVETKSAVDNVLSFTVELLSKTRPHLNKHQVNSVAERLITKATSGFYLKGLTPVKEGVASSLKKETKERSPNPNVFERLYQTQTVTSSKKIVDNKPVRRGSFSRERTDTESKPSRRMSVGGRPERVSMVSTEISRRLSFSEKSESLKPATSGQDNKIRRRPLRSSSMRASLGPQTKLPTLESTAKGRGAKVARSNSFSSSSGFSSDEDRAKISKLPVFKKIVNSRRSAGSNKPKKEDVMRAVKEDCCDDKACTCDIFPDDEFF